MKELWDLDIKMLKFDIFKLSNTIDAQNDAIIAYQKLIDQLSLELYYNWEKQRKMTKVEYDVYLNNLILSLKKELGIQGEHVNALRLAYHKEMRTPLAYVKKKGEKCGQSED